MRVEGLVISFLLLHLFSVCSSQNIKEKSTSYAKNNGDNLVLTSPNFPKYSNLNGKVYNYFLENKNTDGYIRIVFLDFKIHNLSAIKIYDGDMHGQVSAWTSMMKHPVFQSSGRKLVLVYKTGKTTPNEQTKYPGWKANIFFVSEKRNLWKNIPSTGLCPNGTGNSVWIKINRERLDQPIIPYLDCIWSTSNRYIGNLAVIMPDKDDGSLELLVRNGRTSQDRIISNKASIRNGRTYLMYTISRYFYVHLKGEIPEGQSFKMAYGTSETAAQNAVDRIGKNEIFQLRCPYVDCEVNYNKYGCQKYWTSCGNRDPACNHQDYVGCSDTDQCYDRVFDKCDRVTDCGNKADESECEQMSSFTSLFYFGMAVFLIAGICGGALKFASKVCHSFCKYISDCCDYMRDGCRSIHSVISNICTECGRLCEDCFQICQHGQNTHLADAEQIVGYIAAVIFLFFFLGGGILKFAGKLCQCICESISACCDSLGDGCSCIYSAISDCCDECGKLCQNCFKMCRHGQTTHIEIEIRKRIHTNDHTKSEPSIETGIRKRKHTRDHSKIETSREIQIRKRRYKSDYSKSDHSKSDTSDYSKSDTNDEKSKKYDKKTRHWAHEQNRENEKGTIPTRFFVSIFICLPVLLGFSVCFAVLCKKINLKVGDILSYFVSLLSCEICYKLYQRRQERHRGQRRQERHRRQREAAFRSHLRRPILNEAVSTQPTSISTSDRETNVHTTDTGVGTGPDFTDVMIGRASSTVPTAPISTLDPEPDADPTAPPSYAQLAISSPGATAGSSRDVNDAVPPSYDQAVKNLKVKDREIDSLPPPPTYDDVINDESSV